MQPSTNWTYCAGINQLVVQTKVYLVELQIAPPSLEMWWFALNDGCEKTPIAAEYFTWNFYCSVNVILDSGVEWFSEVSLQLFMQCV